LNLLSLVDRSERFALGKRHIKGRVGSRDLFGSVRIEKVLYLNKWKRMGSGKGLFQTVTIKRHQHNTAPKF
jgi:hypothetical protein